MKKLALIPLLGLLLAIPFAQAQTQDGTALLEALRAGGHVIVMRHASSPRQEPDAASANPDNVDRERQLDATGRADATAMGEALRRNGIGITSIHSSPTYRALETAGLMGFDNAQTHEELGNEGMADSSEARGVWLRERTAEAPAEGNAL